ncbi:hypothetical protein ACO1O0_002675 [Amphichorda felina]
MSDYKVYTYWRSSCSARLRIGLDLKAISYDQIPVNLLKNEQQSPEHKSLNPSGSVPLLLRNKGHAADTAPFRIGQSVAALEYLDEVHPASPLLPPTSNPEGRATVRTLVNIISCDIQPVTNLRIMRRVTALGGDAEEWNRDLFVDGLLAYEAIAATCAGKYSYGDSPTIADVCLMPAIWNARRFKVPLDQFPIINRVAENMEQLPAVAKASYFKQPDTPEDMRSK